MKKIFLKDVVNVTGGELLAGDLQDTLENVSTDTREIKKNDTYIGIKGENFDGNQFWQKAFEGGAKTVIVQDVNFTEEELQKYSNKNIIEVKDTIKALGKIAKYKRSLYDIPVVAITGSVGKTSTKDIVANVVSQKYKTLKTIGNFNNHIGVPLTILKLAEHEAAVIEMGMNHEGEISYLTNIAKPTISVITNIGTSHIGFLGSRENILKAKTEILEGMERKLLVVNNDNDLLHKFVNENKSNFEIKTFGIENASAIMASDIHLGENGSDFVCSDGNSKIKIHIPVGGTHFVYNSLCATAVGSLLGIDLEQIKQGIESFELTKKRMEIITLKNGAKIINDSYNASFESMKASISYLLGFGNSRKIAVLGDMLELGDFSKKLHNNVGKEVAKNNIDLLICIGNEAKYIAEGAESMGAERVKYFESKDEALEFMRAMMGAGDVFLFKASNGMRFFDLVENLQN